MKFLTKCSLVVCLFSYLLVSGCGNSGEAIKDVPPEEDPALMDDDTAA